MQRIIGVGLGGLVTWVLLWFMVGSEYTSQFTSAVVIGAIVSALWPWVIGLILARRVKARRDEQISKEVDAQIKAKGG